MNIDAGNTALTRFKNCLLICGLYLTVISSLQAATFTVTNNNGGGPGSFSTAVADANTSFGEDTIEFGSVSGTITLTSQIVINESLIISGPGATSLTISLAVSTGVTAGALRLNAGSLSISGLTLERTGTGTERILYGNQAGSITLDSVRLFDSATDDYAASGGAIAVLNTDLTLDNVLIEDFSSVYRGGAVFAQADAEAITVQILDSTFLRNVTTADYSAGQNITSSNGGALFSITNSSGTIDMTISGSLFENNSTSTSGTTGLQISGGAVAAEGVALTIDTSVFRSNYAQTQGGALYAGGDNLSIRNTTFASNSTAGDGGAIFLDAAATATIENSTISGNQAVVTPGISSGGTGAISIRTSTMAENRSNVSPTLNIFGNGTYIIENSIIVGGLSLSSSDHNPSIDCQCSSITLTNSLIGFAAGDAPSGAGIVYTDSLTDTDPMLGALGDNGGTAVGSTLGSQLTMPTHAVNAGSPAIDAGNASLTSLTEDQRGAGFARVQGSGMEIGAVEFDEPTTTDGGGGTNVDVGGGTTGDGNGGTTVDVGGGSTGDGSGGSGGSGAMGGLGLLLALPLLWLRRRR